MSVLLSIAKTAKWNMKVKADNFYAILYIAQILLSRQGLLTGMSDRVYQDLDSGATSWSSIGPEMNLMKSMYSYPKPAVPFKKKEGLRLASGLAALLTTSVSTR